MKDENNWGMGDVIYHGLDEIYDNKIHIAWDPVNVCNYRCSYCFGKDGSANKNLKNAKYSSLEELKVMADSLISLNKDAYSFTLAGTGEPTIHPYLIDFFEYFSSFGKYIKLFIVSNGSRSLKFYEKILEMEYVKEFSMKISLHLEFVDINHIKDIIKLFNQYNQSIGLSLMFNPDRMEQCCEVFETFLEFRKNNSFNFDIIQLRDGNKVDSRYTEKDFIWMDESQKKINSTTTDFERTYQKDTNTIRWGNSHYLLKDGSNTTLSHAIALRTSRKDFSGFQCCAGTNFIHIRHSGSYNGANCGLIQNVGNVFEDGFIDSIKLANSGIICSKNFCGCVSNDRIPKFRSKESANEYILSHITRLIENISPSILAKSFVENKKHLDTEMNSNWLPSMFGVFNSSNRLVIVVFFIKITFKMTPKRINKIAWWIPVRKWRQKFRAKFQ